MKNRVILLAILGVFLINGGISAFIYLPYQKTSHGDLDFSIDIFRELSHTKLHTDVAITERMQAKFNMTFSFQRLSYGITGIQVWTPIEVVSLIGHNLIWSPLEFQLPFMQTKHSVQLGVLHLGVPKIAAKYSLFNISNQRRLKQIFLKRAK